MKKIFPIIGLFLLLCACNLQDIPLFFNGTQAGDGNEAPTMTSTPCPPESACGLDPTPTLFDKTPGTLLFADEFNGTTLNAPFRPLPIWFSDHGVTDEGANAQAIFFPESVYVSDGYLHLRAEKLPSPDHGMPYSSGYVQTGGYFQDWSLPKQWFKYGYFEARINVPVIEGTWPAFWLWADPISYLEIDIVEIIMRKPHVTYHTLHNDGQIFQQSRTFSDPLVNWHTYAVDWQPGLIVWYVDGVETARYEDTANLFSQEMYLIFTYQLGGDWAGPVDESKLPAEMLVDYVRVWSRKP